jgi:hypothetical protein
LAQVVIVFNRVAVPDKNAKQRAGGLEVAVNAAFKNRSGIWFGWSGKVTTHTKIATPKGAHDEITYITLDLSKEDHRAAREPRPSARSITIASPKGRLSKIGDSIALRVLSRRVIPKPAFIAIAS